MFSMSAEGTPEHPEVPDFHNSFAAQYDWLESLGFEVVEHVFTNGETLKADIERFKDKIPTYDIPSDGLVLAFEDIAYGIIYLLSNASSWITGHALVIDGGVTI